MSNSTVKSNWLDSVVSYFNPVAGLRRRQARMAQEVLRKYEGASAGRRTGGWTTSGGGSANTEIGPALSRVRERVRDLVRNNPYAGRAISLIESNTIGTGILGQVSVSEDAKRTAKLSGLWKDWCYSTDADADGLHDFYGLQALTMRTVAESGEALVVRRWRRLSDGYRIPVPMQIQILEGDYIDTSKEGPLADGAYILQGIEFNKRGRRVAYWLWNQHPGERILSTKKMLQSERVPATDIRHVFRADRAGQVRGISWGSPCVIRLRDFDEYEDAQLLRQRIAACFSAFVQDMEMPIDSASAKEKFLDKLEPGAIEILPPGKEITFPNMPTVNDDGHSARVLRAIAMGFGVTYEALTGDLSNVNFSSGRMGWIEFQRNIEKWRWLMFIPRFCFPVYGWFLEAAAAIGAETEGAQVVWTPPRREMIDPTKEVPAKRDEIRSGLISLSEAIRENGRVPEELFAEISKDQHTLDQLKLILDCDPRHISRGGNAQSPVQGEGGQPNADTEGA